MGYLIKGVSLSFLLLSLVYSTDLYIKNKLKDQKLRYNKEVQK